ncbi:hypothetical protein B0H21DRAFT_753682 [Amylocystis lapponica]|nr:hypothetical protein B0H21DRAFT_753682 [Amylocystis lapponica]
MATDVFSHFSPLDELIQVIYQGTSRFVVLSAVDDVSWTVHVGLSGGGRWWSGRWAERDVHKAVGSAKSTKLEAFAERLADIFVQGELHITDWSPEKGARINLTLGAGSKTPAHVPLAELSGEAAAAFATTVFTEIAIQAQSRKCQLHPSPYEVPSTTSLLRREPTLPQPSFSSTRTSEDSTDEVQALRAELAKARDQQTLLTRTASLTEERYKRKAEEQLRVLKAKLTKTEDDKAATDSSKLVSIAKGSRGSAAAPHKGASLANPSRKARKYQALEFGSDED